MSLWFEITFTVLFIVKLGIEFFSMIALMPEPEPEVKEEVIKSMYS